MAETTTHLAMFDEVNPASEAILRLREIGVLERDMEVLSGVPFSERILGRAQKETYVPLLGILGALFGLGAGVALSFGTPFLYPLIVGGKPLYSIPTSLVVIFETTMLGLLVFTFLGVWIENGFPTYRRAKYHPEVSDGKIIILFDCTNSVAATAYEALRKSGASEVRRAEAIKV